MYSMGHVKKGLSNPNFLAREINRLFHTRLHRREYNTDGADIVSEDWDNLVLLDGCRYDMFVNQNQINGDMEKRTSRGSNTVEFLTGNFSNRDLNDTVYITANPQFRKHRENLQTEFASVDDVWMGNGWDSETGTVLPETVTDRALGLAQEYPNKRLIVHYLQPHYPFIQSSTEFDKGQIKKSDERSAFWQEIMKGNLSIDNDLIWESYKENLNAVLPSVQRLVSNISGKTVVTSDHGNMIGERAFPIPIKEYGHPIGIYTSELVEVPWFIAPYDDRKRVHDRVSSTSYSEVDNNEVEDRLRKLGYL